MAVGYTTTKVELANTVSSVLTPVLHICYTNMESQGSYPKILSVNHLSLTTSGFKSWMFVFLVCYRGWWKDHICFVSTIWIYLNFSLGQAYMFCFRIHMFKQKSQTVLGHRIFIWDTLNTPSEGTWIGIHIRDSLW